LPPCQTGAHPACNRKRPLMSPNDYDPKEVAALQPESLEAATSDAIGSFDRARDLDELAAAHSAHLGPRAPVALARRELGALPPQARADAGKRVNAALATITAAYDQRHDTLVRERDELVLATESVDVTLPADPRPPGGRHPLA